MRDKCDAARRLAEMHFDLEPGITRIFTLHENPEQESLPTTPIKLLEVNADTVSSGILPLCFGAAPESGIRYPSCIIEVTPTEFERIQARELKLPEGWSMGEELMKPAHANGSP